MKSLIFISIAFITQNLLATPVMPVTPTYATCQMVTVHHSDAPDTTEPDPACVSQNESARTTYNSNVDTYNSTRQVIADIDPNSNIGYLLKPDLPAYKDCRSQVPPYATDSACTSQNQSLSSEYQNELADYDDAKRRADEAEALRLETVAEEQSTLNAINEANAKNKAAHDFYGSVSQFLYAKSNEADSSIFGCSALCSALREVAGQCAGFAQTFGQQEYEGCLAANQVSTNTLPCAIPSSFGSPNGTSSFGGTGLNDECYQNPSAASCVLPGGVPLTDIIGSDPSSFAGLDAISSKGVDPAANAAIEKKYKNADFSSEKAMIASGISPIEAKAISGMMQKISKGADRSIQAALNKNKLSAATAAGTLANNKGSSSTSGSASGNTALNGDAKGINKNRESTRTAASLSEGLAKNFNGELIGLPGDDIFKMMSRRYKLKTSQNNFIAP